MSWARASLTSDYSQSTSAGGVQMQMKLWFVSLSLVASAGLVLAATRDVPGSKDHPLVKRYEGSVIIKYSHNAYDEYTISLGKAVDAKQLVHSTRVEGEVTRL